MALIADVARTATVGAAEDCALLRIDAAAFWDILSRNIQLSLFIETIADHRSRETQSFKTATCTKEVG